MLVKPLNTYKSYFNYYLIGVVIAALLSMYVSISIITVDPNITPENVSSLFPVLIAQGAVLGWFFFNIALSVIVGAKKEERSWFSIVPNYYVLMYIAEGVLGFILSVSLGVLDSARLFLVITIIQALVEIVVAAYLLVKKPYLK